MSDSSERSDSRRIKYLLLTVLCFIAAFAVTYAYLPDYRNALKQQRARSGKAVLDRKGRLLRIFPDNKGNFCVWRPLERGKLWRLVVVLPALAADCSLQGS